MKIPFKVRFWMQRRCPANFWGIYYHGSYLWGFEHPKDVDVLFITNEGRRRREVIDGFDVSYISICDFIHQIRRRDVQYLVFMFLPSKFVLFESRALKLMLEKERSEMALESVTIEMHVTNQTEAEFAWHKAERLFADQCYYKSKKCISYAFRRACFVKQILERGRIYDLRAANHWWHLISSAFDEAGMSWTCIELLLATKLNAEMTGKHIQSPRNNLCISCFKQIDGTSGIIPMNCKHTLHVECAKAYLADFPDCTRCPVCDASYRYLGQQTKPPASHNDRVRKQICEIITQDMRRIEIVQMKLGSLIVDHSHYPLFTICRFGTVPAVDVPIIIHLHEEQGQIRGSSISGEVLFSMKQGELKSMFAGDNEIEIKTMEAQIAMKLGVSIETVRSNIHQLGKYLTMEDLTSSQVFFEVCMQREAESRFRKSYESWLKQRRTIMNEIFSLRKILFDEHRIMRVDETLTPTVTPTIVKNVQLAKERKKDPSVDTFKYTRCEYRIKQVKCKATSRRLQAELAEANTYRLQERRPRTKTRSKNSGKHSCRHQVTDDISDYVDRF